MSRRVENFAFRWCNTLRKSNQHTSGCIIRSIYKWRILAIGDIAVVPLQRRLIDVTPWS